MSNEAQRFKITLAGTELQQGDDPGGIFKVVVEDHCNMIGMAQITLDREGSVDWTSLTPGADVVVDMGGDGNPNFTGYIVGLRHTWSGGRESVTVIAMDPLCKMAGSRVTKIYEEQTDSDIVSAVISAAGCSAGTVDSTDATHKYVIQRNESNLTFAKRLAARNGYLLMADKEGKIEFKKAQFSGSSKEIGHDKLAGLDYSWNTMAIPTQGVKTIGWDYVAKEKVEGEASSIDTIGGGSAANSSTGDIWKEKSFISDVFVKDAGVATAMAKAELNRASRFLRGVVKIQGDGSIRAGDKVKVIDMPTGFGPEGFVVSARHVGGSDGYYTELHFVGNTFPE